MADYADLELAKIEKEIHQVYTQAQKELQEKWDKYMAKAQPKVNKAKAAAEAAMLDPNMDPVKAQKLSDAYQKAALNMTLQNSHYQEMVNQTTNKLAETNQIALSYINDQMPKVYCHSYNEFADQHIAGYSFELVNEDAVKYLVKSGNTNLLPQKKLNFEKDKAWNTKQINSQVLQGILQGESMDEITKRLFSVIHDPKETNKNIVHKNEVSARRAAQTMVTGAQNKGRQDSFERASNDGVKMKRIWVAAHDDRTRTSHLDLHGKSVAVDEPFHSMYGDIMYPGDPSADPRDVYNCRCAIRVKVLGFDWSKQPEAEYKSAYADQYQGTGVTAQYYSMLDENKALGNEFWKLLNANGKPSAVWKDYLAGNTVKTLTKEIDDVLAKYKGTGKPIKPGAAKKASVVVQEAPKPDLGMYQDKSMTATFYSVKAENKDLGKEFWAILQAEENPSQVWQQYLIGTASKEVTEKLDKILLQHKGEGAWTKPVSAKKAASKVDKADDLLQYKKDLPEDLIDAKNITFAKNEDDWKKIQDILINSKDKSETWAKYWYKYVKGDVENTELDKILLPQFKKMAKADAKVAAKAAAEAEDLVKAQTKLAAAKGNLDSIPNTTYTGIWKEPVSLSDYEAKAASIQAKKQYYLDGIEQYKNLDPVKYSTQIKQFEKYIDDLADFETQGKLYVQYEKAYKEAAKEVKKLTPVGETFGPDAYTQMRKDNAIWAKSGKEADDVLREASGEVWRNAKAAEKSAAYEYTRSYHKFNEPLRGIEYGSNAYKGVGNTDLNAGYQNNGKKLNALTDILDKAKLPQDQWFQRGCGFNGMDKFFACDPDLLRYGTQEELEKALLGKTVTEYGFMSMGSAKGQGFSGDILMNIYAPQGTKAMYVEPFSAFGNGSGKSWDGKSKQSSFGHELETLLQQNTDFRITKIERKGNTIYFDLEIIAQNEPQRWKG